MSGGYLPLITLVLVCRETDSDQQRLSNLRAELSRFYGKQVEFHLKNEDKTIPEGWTHESLAWDDWEIRRAQLDITHSQEYVSVVELHQSPVRSRRGVVDRDAEVFLEHLVEIGCVDWAIYDAYRDVHLFHVFAVTRPALVELGNCATLYMFNKNEYLKRRAGTDGKLSYWEMHDIVSANIKEGVVSLATRKDIRSLINAVDKQLRIRLGEGEFQKLLASFVCGDPAKIKECA